MEIFWYVLTVLAILIPPVLEYVYETKKKEKLKKLVLLVTASFAAVFSFIIYINSKNDADSAKLEAKLNDSLYKSQLKKNLEASIQIIDSMRYQMTATRKVLKNSSDLLGESTTLQNKTNAALSNTNKTLLEFDRINTSINDVFLDVVFDFKLSDKFYLGSLPFESKSNAIPLLINKVSKGLESSTKTKVTFIDGRNLRLGDTLLKIADNNVVFYKQISNRDTTPYKLIINATKIKSGAIKDYDRLFPIPAEFDLMVYKTKHNFKNALKKLENENINPNLCYQLFSEKQEESFDTYGIREINFKTNLITCELFIKLSRTYSDNSIISALDLKNSIIKINPHFVGVDYTIRTLSVSYGHEFSETLRMKPINFLYRKNLSNKITYIKY